MRTFAALFTLASIVAAQSVDMEHSTGGFEDTGSDSFYWHSRYHGLLAMAGYGNPNVTCRQLFTEESRASNFPSSTHEVFDYLGAWGPTEKYGISGYNVIVPEMNKVVMVFTGVTGWENFNATLVPLLGVGCDSTCMAHAGAIEAFEEAQAATNDWQVIKSNQQNFVWSSSGHGFGGMVSQIAAMSLKHRRMAYSSMTFGAPPVFNAAAARRYNDLFPGPDSQRVVANRDSVPAAIPIDEAGTGYTFVNTGIHVFGTSPTYGQDFEVCYDAANVACHGGDNAADHWFYYDNVEHCGASGYATRINQTFVSAYEASAIAGYSATATGPIRTAVNTSDYDLPTTSTSTTESSTETTPADTTTDAPTGALVVTSTPTSTSSNESGAKRAVAGLGSLLAVACGVLFF